MAEALLAAIEEVLLSEGCAPGNSIHSWRCEYPDRYDPCTCVPELAEEIVAMLRERGYVK